MDPEIFIPNVIPKSHTQVGRNLKWRKHVSIKKCMYYNKTDIEVMPFSPSEPMLKFIYPIYKMKNPAKSIKIRTVIM